MLAQLQRIWVALLVVGATTCAAAVLHAGAPWWAALVSAVVVLNIHALPLAAEFAMLSRLEPDPGVPKPSARTLLRAWWGEVRIGVQVFCWRQPFLSSKYPDRLQPSAARHRGVVLIHGFVCNRGLWNPWMRRLSAMDVPFIAVNLEPIFGSIDSYVRTVDDAIARMQAVSGQAPVVVAHSMGGLAVRAWMREPGTDRRVHSVVTVGTPHAGTTLASLALAGNVRQMRRSSPWLQGLAACEPADRMSLFTCYYGNCDNISAPASTGTLPGADNRHLPGVAHVHLIYQDDVIVEVMRRLPIDTGTTPHGPA